MISKIYLLLFLGLCLFLYSLGWTGSWHFDDQPNLQKLSSVFQSGSFDAHSAASFIFEGTAGPLGRPLSLLSFLVDGSGWPFYPAEMLYTNTMLHIMNGLLVWLFLFQLGKPKFTGAQSIKIATFAALTWVLLPIHASSVLMAIQRMTLLSSSFMLLGFIFYLSGRHRLKIASWKAWFPLLAGLFFGVVCGILAKEQAAIFPILILVIERFWLPPVTLKNNKEKNIWSCFQILFLYLPLIFTAIYLTRIILNAEAHYSSRDFSLTERLLTQSIILWDYLRLSFLPVSNNFGPFHDDQVIYGWGIASIIAIFAWLIALFFALIGWKKKSLWTFSVFWFLACHLIESSVVPLELYFEHRNYLAVLIPVFSLIVFIYEKTLRIYKYFNIAATSYLLLLSLVLYQTTSLFGQPAIAAEIWHSQHPGSIRATQYLAQSKIRMSDLEQALSVLDKLSDLKPNSAMITLQAFQLACLMDKPHDELEQRKQRVLQELPIAPQRFSIITSLDKIRTIQKSKDCQNFIQDKDLVDITYAALKNEKIAGFSTERANLHIFLAAIFIDAKQIVPTMENLIKALQIEPSIENIKLAAVVLKSAGLGDQVPALIQEHPPRYPKNPILKEAMVQELNNIQTLAVKK